MVETECLAGFSEERSEVFLGKCASRSDGDDSIDVPMLACGRTSSVRKSLDERLTFADCSLVPPLLTSEPMHSYSLSLAEKEDLLCCETGHLRSEGPTRIAK